MTRVCESPAMEGPCVLPAGHNMGKADVPANHSARHELLSTAGSTPELSNELAEIVSGVCWRVFGRDFYVPLDLRYGIAHEVQRAGFTKPERMNAGQE